MAKAYYIPNGTKNLQSLFPGLDFSQIAEYFLEVIDDNDTIVATTTKTLICGCEDSDDMIRIHFLNSLGGIDAINFKLAEEEHVTESDSFQVPTTYPLERSVHSKGRFNVRANDNIKAITTDWGEKEKEWLDELFDSPVAWLEWSGEQGQPDDFIPIVISNITRTKIKREYRYVYEIEVQFSFSHDKFIIRN